jgi:hypothetical protein
MAKGDLEDRTVMEQSLKIGHLLRAGVAGFVAGMRVSEWDSPAFGSLLRIPLEQGYEIYGMIHDIHIDDDGIVRQLVTAENIADAVIADNRQNRFIPIEISVISVGYAHNGQVRHLLPPRPPLSLDSIYLCSDEDLFTFTNAGRFGYFRHILRNADAPVGELLAAHIEEAQRVHGDRGNGNWGEEAARELIVLLRDDYPTLMSVLSAIGEIDLTPPFQET